MSPADAAIETTTSHPGLLDLKSIAGSAGTGETPYTPPCRWGAMPVQSVETASIADIVRAVLRAIFRMVTVRGISSGRGGCDDARRRYEGRLLLSRWLFFALVCMTTAVGVGCLWTVLRVDSTSILEWCLLAVFAILFSWIAIPFWLACFGTYARLRGVPLDGLKRPDDGNAPFPVGRPRTAIIMPIYNEEVTRLFAGLTATCESLCEAGRGDEFEVYVLSDSTDSSIQAAEEREWRRMRNAMAGCIQIYYRHRERNTGRKSGNIADFCRSWGSLYDYMVVVDADSLMTGETLFELVRLMDANPDTALIQTTPNLVGQNSLFGRIQQFANSVYGQIYASGLAYLQGADGNYWGHNAIIRVAPFMRHCGLPVLSGKPPFGGEILSHDFVEAALLRRAGWEVWLVPELGGSYEEAPPTVTDYLARDRRWFQGNLQHARLILTRGLRLPSRLHLALGIMSYLSSPLWLLLIILSTAVAYAVSQIEPVTYMGPHPVLAWPVLEVEAIATLISAMVVLLFGPKVLALLLLSRDSNLMRAHGGFRNLTASVLWESAFSILFAPVAMLSHTRFVIDILLGRTTPWNSQNRSVRNLPVTVFASDFAMHTAFGVSLALAVYLTIPHSAWWLLPIVTGLVLAIPLAYVSSGAQPGRRARERLLFLVPSETTDDGVLRRLRAVVDRGAGKALSPSE